jgi:hypothetical protein
MDKRVILGITVLVAILMLYFILTVEDTNNQTLKQQTKNRSKKQEYNNTIITSYYGLDENISKIEQKKILHKQSQADTKNNDRDEQNQTTDNINSTKLIEISDKYEKFDFVISGNQPMTTDGKKLTLINVIIDDTYTMKFELNPRAIESVDPKVTLKNNLNSIMQEYDGAMFYGLQNYALYELAIDTESQNASIYLKEDFSSLKDINIKEVIKDLNLSDMPSKKELESIDPLMLQSQI